MKQTVSLTGYNIFVLICLFTISFGYSQDTRTLFGKPANKESVNPQNRYVRCASTEYEKYLQEKDPKRMTEAQFETWVTPLVKRYAAMRSTKSKTSASTTVITIPVVVHVIYNGQAIGVAPNITDEQVQSQITVMNQDYSKMIGTPGYNTNPVGANTQIQFVLAQVDPSGNPTNGIDRVSLCQATWSETEMDSTVKPATIWDPTQYMNMWSVNFSDNTLLGYAQFPNGSTLQGINTNNGTAGSDGVVANYNVFGSSDYGSTFLLNTAYNKGRTMTHEVGHFLGLRHIWGDGTGDESKNSPDCTASDYCNDTPQVGWEHYVCGIFDTCPLSPGKDMPENYMDYTPDLCMNIFTQNQADRMAVVMTNSPRRNTLKTSTKGTPITLFANDAEVKLEKNCGEPACGLFANQTVQRVMIYNRGTTTLTAAVIKYKINSGNDIIYNWTGSLAINKYATFDITINSVSNGTLSVSIVSANGVTDQRSSNDSVSGNFSIPPMPNNFDFTNYVFNLQQDLWGSETTWNLKDGSGVVKYSGGPYTDKPALPLPTLITQNWILVSNQCYTFTINDKAGDGICCGTSGDGFYSIKSTDGLSTIASGTTFGSSQITPFTTNSLAKSAFENSKDIYLYPNPTKDVLNIRIPSNLGLPNSYTIYNNLGQIISVKEVTLQPDLSVNTSDLSSGTYFVTITKGDAKKTIAFIKE